MSAHGIGADIVPAAWLCAVLKGALKIGHYG